MKKSIPFGKGEGWHFAFNEQYLMKRSFPFGKDRMTFGYQYCLNSIWWKGLFDLEMRGMTSRYQ